MDEEGYTDILVADTKYLKFNRVGKHITNYDFLINLAHFKGHAMGGFGGVKVLTNAASLSTIEPGVYIVNGKKTTINQ